MSAQKSWNWSAIAMSSVALLAVTLTACSKKDDTPASTSKYRGLWVKQAPMQVYQSFVDGGDRLNTRRFCERVNSNPRRFGIDRDGNLTLAAFLVHYDGAVSKYTTSTRQDGDVFDSDSTQSSWELTKVAAGRVDGEGVYYSGASSSSNRSSAVFDLTRSDLLKVTQGPYYDEQETYYIRSDETELEDYVFALRECIRGQNFLLRKSELSDERDDARVKAEEVDEDEQEEDAKKDTRFL